MNKLKYVIFLFIIFFCFGLNVRANDSYGGAINTDISIPIRLLTGDIYGSYNQPQQNSAYFYVDSFCTGNTWQNTRLYSLETQDSYSAGNLYSITIYLYNTDRNIRIIPAPNDSSQRRIGTGNSTFQAYSNWVANNGYSSNTEYTNYSYDFFDVKLVNGTIYSGIYSVTYFFVPPQSNNSLAVPFGTSTYNCNGDYYFAGYRLQNLGSANNLTSSDISNVINNSGLATARSVQDVQTGINQVQQELSNLEQTEINNTQDIINNQNSNTQQQIDSQKICSTIDKSNIKSDNKYLNSSGSLVSLNSTGVTDYIKINSNSELKTINNFSGGSAISYCFYNTNKELISCSLESSLVVNNNISIPSNSEYVRFSIIKSSNLPSFQLCNNGNQALHDSLNDSDSSGATSEASDFFNSFTTDTFGLTSIVTAPLNLIQSLTSSTCTNLRIPIPFVSNQYLELPCMTPIYQSYFGILLTLYQTITFGIIAYWVCVRILNQVKDFKNPEHDEIEVLDL